MIRMITRTNGDKVYYLHKTFTKDSKYQGSGVKWKKFLKKYESKLIWESKYYTDPIELQYEAIKLSLEHNIIESNLWANDKLETGLDGGYISSNKNLKQRNNKTKKTFNNSTWKKTIGKKRSESISKTMSDPKWKEEVGKEARKKQSKSISKTKSDPKWKEEVGQKAIQKHKKTINNEEWINQHWKTCEVCKKGPMRPNLFSRYHSNCIL